MDLRRWYNLRKQAQSAVRPVARAAQIERSTIPVVVEDEHGDPVEVEVPVPDALGSGVRAGADSKFAKELAEELGLRTDELEDGVEQAQLTADQKNRTFRSSSPPSGEASEGDRWEQYDKSSTPWKLLGSWTYESTGWVKAELDSTYLPLVDIGSGTFGQLGGSRLAADAIDGKTIRGVEVRGGDISLLADNELWAYETSFDDLDGWFNPDTGLPLTAANLSNEVVQTGTYSLKIQGSQKARYTIPVPTILGTHEVAISYRIETTSPGTVGALVRAAGNHMTLGAAGGGVWLDFDNQVAVPSALPSMDRIELSLTGTGSGTSTLYVDAIRVEMRGTEFESNVTLSRDASGMAALSATGTEGRGVHVKQGVVEFTQFRHEPGHIGHGYNYTLDIDVPHGLLVHGESESAVPASGIVLRPNIWAGGSYSDIATHDKELRISSWHDLGNNPRGGVIDLWSRTLMSGNVFATKTELDTRWNDAIDGTRAWVASENREYVRVNGAWQIPGGYLLTTDSRSDQVTSTTSADLTVQLDNLSAGQQLLLETSAISAYANVVGGYRYTVTYTTNGSTPTSTGAVLAQGRFYAPAVGVAAGAPGLSAVLSMPTGGTFRAALFCQFSRFSDPREMRVMTLG